MKKWPYVYKRADGRFDVDTGRKITPRRRQICESETEVAQLRADWLAELKRGGSQHFLTAEQRHDAQQALDLMAKENVNDSLSTAVAYYVKHRYPHGGDLTVAALAKHFIESKKAVMRVDPETGEKVRRYSEPYLISLHKLNQLGEAFENKRLSNLQPEDIAEYLDGMKLNDVSRYHYHNYFKMLFNYGVKHRFLERNPMVTMQSPLMERRDPKILTVEQAEALTVASFQDHDGVTFVYTVLGLFAGIRPHEITKLKWGDLKQWGWQVRLPARTAKTRAVRSVQLPMNAARMIHTYRDLLKERNGKLPDDDSLIVPMTHNLLRKRFKQAYKAAGLTKWPHDVSRHTFASFYYKATKSMPKLMEQLGHSTPVMALRHYVNLTEESWLDYFTITHSEKLKDEIKHYVKLVTDPDPIPDNPYPPVREADAVKVLLDHDYTVLPADQSRKINPERDTLQ